MIEHLQPVSVRTPDPAVEVAWFSALCNEDYEFLGVPDGPLRSSFEHCSDIVQTADRLGFQNILMPSSFNCGQEPLTFAGPESTLKATTSPEVDSAVSLMGATPYFTGLAGCLKVMVWLALAVVKLATAPVAVPPESEACNWK